MNAADTVMKRIDKLGRITIPAKWRKDVGDVVIMIHKDKEISIIPLEQFKLSNLFDSIEFSGTVEDWVDVKRMKKRIIDEILGF